MTFDQLPAVCQSATVPSTRHQRLANGTTAQRSRRIGRTKQARQGAGTANRNVDRDTLIAGLPEWISDES